MRRDEIEVVWAAGRDAVIALLEAQAARIDELVTLNVTLVTRVEELERQAGRSSRNSSLPPSRDSPQARKERPKKQSGRKQGGQSGHPGRHRPMVADPDHVVEHWPSACAGCGEPISDRVADGDPVAHQVSEIVVRVDVTEHRRMRARCQCGCRTLGDLPAGVPAGAFGPAVVAAAATLTAARVSRRETARLLADLCGLQISPASVETLVKQASDSIEDTYIEVLNAVDHSAVRGADETSWQRAGQTHWLSVANRRLSWSSIGCGNVVAPSLARWLLHQPFRWFHRPCRSSRIRRAVWKRLRSTRTLMSKRRTVSTGRAFRASTSRSSLLQPRSFIGT